jgi:hypothetical protein
VAFFASPLRYQPLTLTTLAALVPPELRAELTLIDEGIADVPERLDVDLAALTVITGTAPRAYELSDRFRRHGITTVLGGPHVTLIRRRTTACRQHRRRLRRGPWPQLLRDFTRGS